MTYPWNGNKNPLAISNGELRHQISIQQELSVQDQATGEPSQTWNTVLTARAKIETVKVLERYQRGTAGEFVSQASHIVTIRWPGMSINIAGGMRVLFGMRTFLILGPPDNVQERNRILNLACLEVNGSSTGGDGCS